MFDTIYHCNNYGERMRTELLAEDINKYLKILYELIFTIRTMILDNVNNFSRTLKIKHWID